MAKKHSGSPLSSLSSDSLHQIPNFVHLEERFKCPVCLEVLKNAVQTSCGHRMCEECSLTIFAKGEPAQCPASDPEEPCEPIYKKQLFRDASARREIRQVPVYCQNRAQGCTVTVPWKDLETHMSNCPYQGLECPNKQYGCKEVIPSKDMDRHVQSACQFRQITCRYCKTQYPVKDERKHHEEDCPETVIPCPFKCGAQPMARKDLNEHSKSCLKKPHECRFKSAGCTFVGTEADIEEHIKNSVNEHLELVTMYTGSMELQSFEIRSQLQEITQQRDALRGEVAARSQENEELKQKVGSLEKTLKELRVKMVGLTERTIILERRLEELPRKEQIEQQSRDLQALKQRTEELQGQIVNAEGGSAIARYGSLSTMADAFTTQLAAHDRQIGIHDVRIAEMDLRFQILETASYDGVLLWKIRDYTRRKQEAVSGRTLSLYSQPFYTSKYGYKMCARVYLNGDGMGKTTHVSLFFVIMRGEYDSLLPWPFQQKVTLYLLDQGAERHHLSDHFHPDPSSSSFRKPQTEMNIASGCPLFVSHSVLENPTNSYLKDDTIFIKIAVETGNLRIV
ncbi:TNF receptor-associated factor 3-like isoform X2 [Haliotis asinina]|uniref:TNF receptor-associated factor 3-like isoform X2 n=1 Tax=Haliotis asinina TaxID=109174 RepID=UPI003531ED7C